MERWGSLQPWKGPESNEEPSWILVMNECEEGSEGCVGIQCWRMRVDFNSYISTAAEPTGETETSEIYFLAFKILPR